MLPCFCAGASALPLTGNHAFVLQMKKREFLLVALPGLCPAGWCTDVATTVPKRIGTTADFRQLLLATKWTWRNASAGVPDRECVFMADGTFRHPHFVAQFSVKDMHVVELFAKKKRKAVMTFSEDYKSFEAIDFENHRITGRRL
jgi:hypothetical protein